MFINLSIWYNGILTSNLNSFEYFSHEYIIQEAISKRCLITDHLLNLNMKNESLVVYKSEKVNSI